MRISSKYIGALICGLIILSPQITFAQTSPKDEINVPIEDADTGPEDFPADNSSQSGAGGFFKNRFYTYSTFLYSPFKAGITLPSSLSFFEEKSGAFEFSAEFSYNNLKNLAGRIDIQSSYSTLYRNETIYPKNYADRIFLNEAFAEYYSSSGFSVLLGKYRMIFTPGIFESPLDRHNSTQASPGEPLERNGVWTAQISQNFNLPFNSISSILISAAFLPRLPQNEYGFWQDSYDVFTLANTPFVPTPQRTGQAWDTRDMGGFVRVYANVFQGDLNLIWYYLDRQHQAGVSYAKYFTDRFELHGEFAGYQSTDIYHEYFTGKQDLYFDYLAGLRFDFDDNSGFVLEYLHQDNRPELTPANIIDKQYYVTAMLNLENEGGMQTPLKDYVMASLRFNEIADRYDIFANVIYGIAHEEALIALRASADISDNLKLSVFGSLPLGPDSSHYGGLLPYEYTLGTEVYGAF